MTRLILPIMLSFILLGCVKSKQAIEYNDFLVSSIDTAMIQLLNTEDAIQEGKYELAKEKYIKLKSVINNQLETVKDKQVFNDEVKLQKAAISWLQYYKKICEDEYVSIFNILESDSLTNQDMEEIKELILSSYDQEEEKHEGFIEVQKEYASKYNFELKEGDFFYYEEDDE